MRIAVATVDVVALALAIFGLAVPTPVRAEWAALSPAVSEEPAVEARVSFAEDEARTVRVDRAWTGSFVASCPGCPETVAVVYAEVQSPSVRVRFIATDLETGVTLQDDTCMESWMPDWPQDRCTLRANVFGWAGDAPHAIALRIETSAPVTVRLSADVLFPGD